MLTKGPKCTCSSYKFQKSTPDGWQKVNALVQSHDQDKKKLAWLNTGRIFTEKNMEVSLG